MRFLNVKIFCSALSLLLLDVTHALRCSTGLTKLGDLLLPFFMEDTHKPVRDEGGPDNSNSPYCDSNGHLAQDFPNFPLNPVHGDVLYNTTNPLAIRIHVFMLVYHFSVLA